MSTPPSKFFNRYEFDEDVRDERDRLRAVNGQLLAALEAANLYLLQSPAVDDYYERVLDDVQAAIAEAQKATGTQL